MKFIDYNIIIVGIIFFHIYFLPKNTNAEGADADGFHSLKCNIPNIALK
jgi:hypothetical protein